MKTGTKEWGKIQRIVNEESHDSNIMMDLTRYWSLETVRKIANAVEITETPKQGVALLCQILANVMHYHYAQVMKVSEVGVIRDFSMTSDEYKDEMAHFLSAVLRSLPERQVEKAEAEKQQIKILH